MSTNEVYVIKVSWIKRNCGCRYWTVEDKTTCVQKVCCKDSLSKKTYSQMPTSDGDKEDNEKDNRTMKNGWWGLWKAGKKLNFYHTLPNWNPSICTQQPLITATSQGQLGESHFLPFWEHILSLSCSWSIIQHQARTRGESCDF